MPGRRPLFVTHALFYYTLPDNEEEADSYIQSDSVAHVDAAHFLSEAEMREIVTCFLGFDPLAIFVSTSRR